MYFFFLKRDKLIYVENIKSYEIHMEIVLALDITIMRTKLV